MKKFLLTLFLLGSAANVSTLRAQADQLQWNSRADAERAAKAIKSGSLLISYCSQCDDQKVEVWWAQRAVVTITPEEKFYEVEVFGKRLLESEQTFDKGKYQAPAVLSNKNLKAKDNHFLEAIDLAYVYVPVGNGRFRVLGKELGLQADVQTEILALPTDIIEKLESREKLKAENNENPYAK